MLNGNGNKNGKKSIDLIIQQKQQQEGVNGVNRLARKGEKYY